MSLRMRCFRVAHLASTHACRMRHKRLIRPTIQAQGCRPDKTRKRRIRQWCSDAGCRMPDAAMFWHYATFLHVFPGVPNI
ncbi:Ribonucleoside-diphosphate reductase 1, beta subunit, B2 [Escherichia coli]|nr:Ribonucleoside-diphosphate reductase 1, beta subunit, B2 [Escherichia coli]